MIRFNPAVRVNYFNLHLAAVLCAASVWSLQARVDVDVNSIGDNAPDRLASSLHPYDLAIDLDTVGDRRDHLAQLAAYLRAWLDPLFDVVLESDHVHVERDHRKGRGA